MKSLARICSWTVAVYWLAVPMASQAAQYKNDWSTLDSVTHHNPGGIYKLKASAGQPLTGNSDSALYHLQLGFWSGFNGNDEQSPNSQPDLNVVMNVPLSMVLDGGGWTGTLLVSNRGPATATATSLGCSFQNIIITSVIPSQGTYAITATGVQCDLGNLPPGASATVTVNCSLDYSALGLPNLQEAGTLTLNASVGSIETDFEPADNITSLALVAMPLRDFGDAYVGPTCLAVGGRHRVLSGYMLGSLIDAESDCQPNDNGVDLFDEDGVTFSPAGPWVPGTTVSAKVTLTRPAGIPLRPAVLDAWLDTDGTGGFDAAAEKVISGVTLSDGLNSVSFTVPAAATLGPTWMRFRLSESGLSTPAGYGGAGEVEDHPVAIANDPPFVTITSPGDGSSFNVGAAITLTASPIVFNGKTVASVTFVDNGTDLVTLTASPYTTSVSSLAPGSHTLRARVVDSAGLVTSSAAVSIVVVVPCPGKFYTWEGDVSGDGYWSDATKWTTPMGVPASPPGGDDVVTISSGKNVTVDASATVCTLNFSGGTITRTAGQTLTVGEVMNWTGGDLAGSGTLIMDTSAVLRLNNGAPVRLSDGVLENAGLVAWNGTGDVRLIGAVVTNRPGAVWIAQNNKAFDWALGDAASRFDNAGTFRKVPGAAGAGTTTFDSNITLNNYGTVDLQSGTVDCVAGLTHSNGMVNLALGAGLKIGAGAASAPFVNAGRVEWYSGTFTLNSGSSFSGPGTNVVSSGNLTVNANVTMPKLELNGGELTRAANQTLTVSQMMNWTGGHLRDTGTLLIDTAAVFRFNHGASAALAGIIENAGFAVWSANADTVLDGAVVTNRAGATWLVENNKKFDWDGGPLGGSRFDNAGTFRKVTGPAGAGTTTFDIYIPFNNYGTVDLQSGTVDCVGSLTHSSGTVNLALGAWLKIGSGLGSGSASAPFVNAGRVEVNGGTFTLNSGCSFSGSGTNVVSGSGNLTVNANVTMRNLELSGGELTRETNQTLTVSQELNWTGGHLRGTGTLLIGTAAVFRFNNGASAGFYGIVENAGLTVWSASADVVLSGTVVTNRAGATWIVQNNKMFDWDGGALGGSRFDNAGTFRKEVGTGTTTFDINNVFNNYGTVDLQTGTVQFDAQYTQYDGLTSLCVGNINNSSPLAITGGVINGTGTISGGVTVSGSGSTSPGCSPGRLRINGNYSQAANCSMEIELGGTNSGISFDQLSVGGTATLGGKVRVNFVNDFYPAPNASFAFLTAAARSGAFASFSYPSNDVGMQLNFSGSNAMIQVINTRPNVQVIANQTIDEMAPFSLAVNATDADSPAQTLTYTLINPPAGATVNSSGLIQWTPTETQGPMTTNITVIVTDNGTPNLSVTRTFQVTVREVNVAPQSGPLNNFTVNAGQTVSFTATATDADLPANSWTFSLVNPPAGATLDANSGLFNWRVPAALAGATTSISVRVTDDGVPPLDATGSFNVNVQPLSPVVLTPLGFVTGQFEFSVTGFIGPDYVFQRAPDLSNWTSFLTNTPMSLPFLVTDTNGASTRQFYRAILRP